MPRMNLLQAHVYGGRIYGPGNNVDLPNEPKVLDRIMRAEEVTRGKQKQALDVTIASLPEGHPIRQMIVDAPGQGARRTTMALSEPMPKAAPAPSPSVDPEQLPFELDGEDEVEDDEPDEDEDENDSKYSSEPNGELRLIDEQPNGPRQ